MTTRAPFVRTWTHRTSYARVALRLNLAMVKNIALFMETSLLTSNVNTAVLLHFTPLIMAQSSTASLASTIKWKIG